MGILNENQIMGASGAGGDFEINNSLRLNDNDTAYLTRTPSSASNRKTWTWSGWVKTGGTVNSGVFDARQTSSGQFTQLNFNSNNILQFYTSLGGVDYSWESLALFRDPSAWYHVVAVLNTPSSTQQDRFIVYVNGVRQANGNQYGALELNVVTWINYTEPHHIGVVTDAGHYFDGYMSEINFIDGLALTPDSFGETSDYGEWKPIKYTGAYGTNGYFLEFKLSAANATNIGKDTSGNGHNFTPSGIAATDQMIDSPTNNFCTMNPEYDYQGTYFEGNLKVQTASTGSGNFYGTFSVTSGKWYYEWQMTLDASNVGTAVGWASDNNLDKMAYYGPNGYKYTVGASSSYGSSWGVGDIIGVAFDADNKSLTFYKNNTAQPTISNAVGTTANSHLPFGWDGSGSPVTQGIINFGQDSSFAATKTAQGNQDGNDQGDFYYAPPSGFLALCTSNLPDADVIPSENFNPVLYTGNQAANVAVTGVGFEPSLVWGKNRSSVSNHWLFDSVRGTTKMLQADQNNAEETQSGVTAFGSDGFTLGTWIGSTKTNDSYVAWNWKAEGSASTNTSGSIDSSVLANTAAGFSILTFTCPSGSGLYTVGHGLGAVPEFMIVKSRSATGNWHIYHKDVGNTKAYFLNNSTAGFTSTGYWGDTTPTSTVFTQSIGGTLDVGTTAIGYFFNSVDGYSLVGSYVGNGSEDGAYVNCGFSPAIIITKSLAATGWRTIDNKRTPYNPSKASIYPDSSGAENTGDGHETDFTSNGFKMRNSNALLNTNGQTYIFIAFAETPFKNSTAR